ncbi:hypothetical protein N9X90_08065 [Alphaproteobacteria bacterium]|nr:hypothetical protein [Alphaproteobacteria bacterium]
MSIVHRFTELPKLDYILIMKTLSHIFLAGLTLTVLACATVSVWVFEPMITKQKFVVIPAIKNEIKVKIVPAINNKIKVRPIGHVGYVGRLEVILKDSLAESDSLPDVICMLRDGEWRERIHNTLCLDVGEQAMRFQRGGETLLTRTTSESNEIIGDCFSDEGRLFCQPYHPARKNYVKL